MGPAKRTLGRLPEKVAAALLEFMNGPLTLRPTIVGKPLGLDREGEYVARRGVWRVVYTLDFDQHIVRVIALGHRADIYRPR